MKQTLLLKDLLYEIGDGSAKPFPLKSKSIDKFLDGLYKFADENGVKYRVDIEITWGRSTAIPFAEISFQRETKEYISASYGEETNAHIQFRILATVLECVKHHIENTVVKEFKGADFSWVGMWNGYSFKGTDSNSGKDAGENLNQRQRFYNMYITRHPLVHKYFDKVVAGSHTTITFKQEYLDKIRKAYEG